MMNLSLCFIFFVRMYLICIYIYIVTSKRKKNCLSWDGIGDISSMCSRFRTFLLFFFRQLLCKNGMVMEMVLGMVMVLYVCMYVCMHACMYVCMFVCMYVYNVM